MRTPGKAKAERDKHLAWAMVQRLNRTRRGDEPLSWGLADVRVHVGALVFSLQERFISLIIASRFAVNAQVIAVRTSKYILGRLVDATSVLDSAVAFVDFLAERGGQVLAVGVLDAQDNEVLLGPQSWPFVFGQWSMTMPASLPKARRNAPRNATRANCWGLSAARLPLPGEASS